ncbi:hypothetical protein [Roseisolibacter sp. H3M3-2]|uniref:hypothetical protein n=1 Tax=Roseisolibacter sp. H3M3-2 TaxID=3031323 RepID=UPI0023DAE7C1|nr:hypothetical protein [Roseisolibacter sp. H3M3-2]MDF1502164.1 hypothetical protein [Roseisolibacter sp. H3M3-2]
MRHLCFAAAIGAAVTAAPGGLGAQAVPGRDLLDFTVGALGEAPALATAAAGGVYNPAAPLLAASGRIRGSLAHVNAPGERGLTGEALGLEWRPRPGRAVAFSVLRAGVADIPRRGDDPTTDLGTVPYDTYVVSLGAAARVQPHVALGAAMRWRAGRVDTTSASELGADVGVVVDGLLGRRDLRLGASTFLWRPRADADDRPLVLFGADARVVGRAPEREVRLGASFQGAAAGEQEGYGFLSGRLRNVEARAGLARATLGAESDTRTRLGLGLRYARLLVQVTREDSPSRFGSIYQITLSSVFK